MDKITGDLIRRFQDEALQVLTEIAERHGFKAEIKPGTKYNSCFFRFQVEIALVMDGEAQTEAQQAWIAMAPLHGLKAEDFGRTFHYNQTQYRVVGWLPKNRRYPILVEDTRTQKRVKMALEVLQWGLSRIERKE